MELNTFGAVLRFALELESRLATFYGDAAQTIGDVSARRVLTELAEAGEQNTRKLEQVRRQQVNEMLLEPIHDVDAAQYEPDLGPRAGEDAVLAAARRAESTAERFYHDMARLLSIPEVARSFARMAEAHARNRQKLSA
jgi:rubrerythrin